MADLNDNDLRSYAEDRVVPIGDNAIATLKDLVQKQLDTEAEIAELEAKLAQRKADLTDLCENKLPSLMESLGTSLHRFESGLQVEVKNQVFVSMPKEKANFGIEWLDANGNSKMVKRQFVISFPKEEDAWANKFAADLKKRKRPLQCEVKKTVHPQTLQAFGREKLEKGEELPEAGFSVHRKKVSIVDIKM